VTPPLGAWAPAFTREWREKGESWKRGEIGESRERGENDKKGEKGRRASVLTRSISSMLEIHIE
jgi:hypothetical protein